MSNTKFALVAHEIKTEGHVLCSDDCEFRKTVFIDEVVVRCTLFDAPLVFNTDLKRSARRDQCIEAALMYERFSGAVSILVDTKEDLHQ